MRKVVKVLGILIFSVASCWFIFSINAKAQTNTICVNLESLEISTNKGDYQKITEYESLDGFLQAYNSNSLPQIYITNFLFDGISSVKTPDLDDFIENDSNATKVKTLEIKVININCVGNVEFTGEITGAMLGINTNNKSGELNIILNNVKIDTDSKKAPAIYVYNKDKNYTDCKVTIKTVAGTENYIEGGKLKKVSLIGSDELSKYSSYYSDESLTNYNKYPSYYGIYTSDEISKILFATVTADREDLQDGDPYVFYKASGAISSDIDLYFEGSGYLKVTSKNKEGIETKGNLTFSGGTGDYEIIALDDCLNTTTASSAGTTVRNDITIDVSSLLASVSEEAEEGDAIDSNGKLIIEGGTIYAFACSTSGDAGIDSTSGTYINGGTVIATGNMADEISNDSKQKFIFVSFNKVSADTVIVLKDQDNNIIAAFKTDRDIQNLVFSKPDLNYESYKVYIGGTIEGKEINGLYSEIDSYTDGEEITSNNANRSKNNEFGMNNKKTEQDTVALIALGAEIVLLVFVSTIYIVGKKNKIKEGKGEKIEK